MAPMSLLQRYDALLDAVSGAAPLFLDMVEDARILYDPERLLAAYLDRLRARLRELGSRRIWLGNAWYWELKPDLKPGEVFSQVDGRFDQVDHRFEQMFGELREEIGRAHV